MKTVTTLKNFLVNVQYHPESMAQWQKYNVFRNANLSDMLTNFFNFTATHNKTNEISIANKAIAFNRLILIEILLIDDSEMLIYNKQYRNKNYATNVLSFPLLDNHSQELLVLGSIVLSISKIQSEAFTLQVPTEQHIFHLLIHGFLHLLGFDHKIKKQAEIMENLENECLRIARA